MSCLSQQHLIRTLPLRNCTAQYDRVSARKCSPLTNEQLSQTKRVREARRKQLTSPQLIHSGVLMVVIFMRSCATCLWRIQEKVEKDFKACIYNPWTTQQLCRTKKVGWENHHVYQLNKSMPFRWSGQGLFYWAKQATSSKTLLNRKIESTWILKSLLCSYEVKDDSFVKSCKHLGISGFCVGFCVVF